LQACLGGTPSAIEKVFPGDVLDVQWLGDRSKAMLLLTSASDVLITRDAGKSFSDLTELHFLKGQIAGLYIVKTNPDFVFLLGKGLSHLFSDNGGDSFDVIRTTSEINEVMLHPYESDTFLFTSRSPACTDSKEVQPGALDDGLDEKGVQSCYKSLYRYRKGTGITLLQKYVLQCDWLAKVTKTRKLAGGVITDELKEMDLRKDQSILCSIPRVKYGKQNLRFWDSTIDLHSSIDDFKHSTVLVNGGNKFLFTDSFLFVAQVVKSDATEVQLQLSGDRTKSFYSGSLPFVLTQHGYTVLDTKDDVVFLHVNHGTDTFPFGHVYISDSTGMNYTFSLKANQRNSQGKCAFERVESLEGVYIANVVDNAKEVEYALGELATGDSRVRRVNPKVKTVISFDRGGEWAYLAPPPVDSVGRQIVCVAPACSLHLHGQTNPGNSIGSVYSTDMAVGIILGTGNVGDSLKNKPDELNTYLSRDGGLSWFEIRKGAHIYEIGDHGGLLVMADVKEETDRVIYSWTQGLEWTELVFTNTKMDVDNIVIEPTSTSAVFHVYGTRDTGAGVSGVVVTIDFSGLHERECQGYSMAQSSSSDYEIWSPRDGHTMCHLGHTIEYTVRKREAACFNPAKFETNKLVKNCECTERDYECDFGYSREDFGSSCVRDTAVSNATIGIDMGRCPPSGQRRISSGYRLVGGNTCHGGKELGASYVACSNGVLGVSSTGWFVIFIIALLVGGLVYVSRPSNAPSDGFGTKSFGEEASSCWSMMVEFIKSRGASANMSRFSRGPESAMEFDDEEFGNDYHDDGDDFDFDDEDDAELISATTDAHPLPTINIRKTQVPKLNAPPTAAPMDLFGDDDLGDAV